jgi:hypothetical protein
MILVNRQEDRQRMVEPGFFFFPTALAASRLRVRKRTGPTSRGKRRREENVLHEPCLTLWRKRK